MNQIVENAFSHNVEESFKKSVNPDQDADNSDSWSVFLVYRCICGKIFTKIRSVVFT